MISEGLFETAFIEKFRFALRNNLLLKNITNIKQLF